MFPEPSFEPMVAVQGWNQIVRQCDTLGTSKGYMVPPLADTGEQSADYDGKPSAAGSYSPSGVDMGPRKVTTSE